MIDSTDTLITGIVLLLIVPMLFIEVPASRKGGYNAAFWRLELDDKLDHIARRPEWFRQIGIIWLFNLPLAAAGMTAFAYQLASEGAGTLSYLALGAFLVGSFAWLAGALLQTTVVTSAAEERQATGTTPTWLQPFWNAGWWAEVTYVTAANAAFVLWGIAMLDTGYPADWMGWTAVVLGMLALALITSTREAFPHLGVIVPVVLGVALILH